MTGLLGLELAGIFSRLATVGSVIAIALQQVEVDVMFASDVVLGSV